ncbi:Uma2 family endonuclease [Plantactinospora sp. WMMB334]|uniref:Uma2 family endonuclease n=1 Tax=Plantactinospora sp. WMMB334 TaxID=3404119 RepID=UPI003B96160C
MTAAPIALDRPGPHGYTTADLHALPDDGRRYELIDGSIIVSPSATIDHNTIARWIANILEDSCPSEEYAVGTDQSTTVDAHNEPRPDVVVTRAEHLRRTPFPITDALLVVEVVSPTSALRDTETKRALYARAGVPAYWIVVPEEEKPTISLAELRLDAGSRKYRYVTHYTTEPFGTAHPWPLRVDLPALTARRARLLGQPAEQD